MYEETHRQQKRSKLLYAVKLRSRMTKAESLLWNALRGKKCSGMKFRRQVPISWFVVDFLCVERQLIIELDGSVHEGQKSYDHERENELRSRGYRIMRFKNDQVLHALPTVLNEIRDAALPSPCRCRDGGRGAGGEENFSTLPSGSTLHSRRSPAFREHTLSAFLSGTSCSYGSRDGGDCGAPAAGHNAHQDADAAEAAFCAGRNPAPA